MLPWGRQFARMRVQLVSSCLRDEYLDLGPWHAASRLTSDVAAASGHRDHGVSTIVRGVVAECSSHCSIIVFDNV